MKKHEALEIVLNLAMRTLEDEVFFADEDRSTRLRQERALDLVMRLCDKLALKAERAAERKSE